MSLKRTVLLGLRAPPVDGWCCAGALVEVAWEKSSDSEASLGLVRVSAVEGLEKPWNCDVRSSSCFWRDGRESVIDAAALGVGMLAQQY